VLPFQATDPLELVHSHIARIPAPIHTRSPHVPGMVSAIVMKLLAKTAEYRYQSGLGLAADLEECLRRRQSTGRIAQFPLGRHEATGDLRIPEKLYGRDRDVATLFAAFERVMEGATEVLLISGHGGIGKSSLVNEVHKAIASRGAYFISGKFEQLRRRAPYATIAGAFREPVRQVLAEGADVPARASSGTGWSRKPSAGPGGPWSAAHLTPLRPSIRPAKSRSIRMEPSS
jgi:hypothetical protein